MKIQKSKLNTNINRALCLTGALLITLAGLLVQTGCGGGKSSGQKEFITVGTATSGGVYAQVGNTIANTIEANKGDLNWSVTAQGSKGTQENIRKLTAGEIEFGMSNAAIAYYALRGEGAWEEKHEIRSVATLAPNICAFVTIEGSGIKTIADLKGKRVVLGPPGAGFEAFLAPLLKAHGVSYEDLTVKNGGFIQAKEMLKDGGADAAFMGGVPPNGLVQGLCQENDVVFIKLDADIADQLSEFPFYAPATVKAGTYEDLTEDLATVNVGNMQLITHADVDEEVVYQFTKLLYENREAIAEGHPAGKAINPKNVAKDVGIPFHPGAIRYFKEAGFIE